jgi:PAS domain S-box-containing protein
VLYLNKSNVEASTDIVLDLHEREFIRVLHVDDEESLLKVAKECLQTEGSFEVETAVSVEEALKKLERERFDVVVSDYQMTGKDGLAFLKELKDENNDIPFIMFTGRGREEVAIKALNYGADQYVNKSGDPETVYGELAHSIRKAVGRKKTMKALKDSEKKYRQLVENLHEGIWATDKDGYTTFVNPRMTEMLGYTVDEMQGKRLFSFIDEHNVEICKHYFEHCKQGIKEQRDFEFIRKDGTQVYARLGTSQITDNDGNYVGALASVVDMTQQRLAEDELRESEEKWRSLVNMAPDGIATIDMKGVIMSVNDAFLGLTGYTKEEIVGKRFTKLQTIRAKDIPRYLKLMVSAFKGKLPPPFEYPYVRKDGTIGWGEAHIGFLKKSGKMIGFQGIFREITERKHSEQALLRAKEFSDSLINSMQDGFSVLDAHGVHINVNPAFCKMTGWSRGELIGVEPPHPYWPPEAREDIERAFQKTLRGKFSNFELTFMRKNSERFPVIVSPSWIKDKQGNVISYFATIKDITERKVTEDTLKKSENKSRTLLENLPQKIFFKDKNSVYISCNENYARDLKIHPDEITGKTDYDFYPKKLAEKYRADDRRIMETGKTEDIEEEYIQNGRKIFVHTVKTPIKGEDGNAGGILGIFWDTTERKQWEDALEHAKEKWTSLTENTDDIVIITDSKGVIQYINKTIPPYTPEETIGKTVYEYVPREQHDVLEKSLREIFKTGKPDSYEVSSSIPKIGTIWFRTKIVPIKHDAKVSGAILISANITDSKKAEEKLKESEEKFKLIFEAARDGILAADAKTKRFVFANPRICEITGYSEKELLRLDVEDIHPKKDLSYVIDIFTKQLQRKIEIGRDVPVLRKDRNVIYCDINSYPLEVGERKLLVGLFRDVTERKKTEEETNRLLHDYSERVKELHCLYGISALIEKNDVSLEEVYQETANLLPSALQFSDVACAKIIFEGREFKTGNFKETPWKQQADIKFHGKKAGIVEACYLEERPFLKEERELMEAVAERLGRIAERKKTEEKLSHTTEKLRVIGGLTRHDVRNKLTTVTGNVYLAKKRPADDPKLTVYLSEIEKAVEQATRIFDFARDYEMLGMEEFTYINVEETVNEATQLFNDFKGIRIANTCRGLRVLADHLLRQVFYNLIDNSLRYGEKASQIKIRYEEKDDHLKLIYKDDGVGISGKIKANLFQKGCGKGTGYGLFLIKRICEVYGWTIQEAGTQGRGVSFIMTIPRKNQKGKTLYELL